MKKKRYLAIDGGGTKGIVSLVYLSYIEYQLGLPSCKIFDIFAGSSSGGIISTLLSVPADEDLLLEKQYQRPKYTALDAIGIYREVSNDVFARSYFNPFKKEFWFGLKNLWGLLGPKYDSSKLASFYDANANVKTKDLLTEVAVTAYELNTQSPYTFNNTDEQEGDLFVKEFALATSAAPTYFKPYKIINKGRYVDGAVYAPTPSNWLLMGIERLVSSGASNLLQELEDTTLVSIGTSALNPDTSKKYEGAEKWGLVQWLLTLFGIFDDGITDTIDAQTRRILGENHYRINVKVDDKNDYSIDTIDRLKILRLFNATKESIRSPDFQDIRKLCVDLQRQLDAEGLLPKYITPGALLPYDIWEEKVDEAFGQ